MGPLYLGTTFEGGALYHFVFTCFLILIQTHDLSIARQQDDHFVIMQGYKEI